MCAAEAHRRRAAAGSEDGGPGGRETAAPAVETVSTTLGVPQQTAHRTDALTWASATPERGSSVPDAQRRGP
jgi:hypothetical protein